MKSHTRFVLLAAYQVDILTAKNIYTVNNNTIMSDGSQKKRKNLMSVMIATPNAIGKATVRSLGIVQLRNKKPDHAAEVFKSICAYYNEIAEKYLFKGMKRKRKKEKIVHL